MSRNPCLSYMILIMTYIVSLFTDLHYVQMHLECKVAPLKTKRLKWKEII